MENKIIENYEGFELGPIRPPSEAQSLLIRITRNCPWNRCKFCGLYKGEKFSIRPVSDVKKDIDLIHHYVDEILNMQARSGSESYRNIISPSGGLVDKREQTSFYTALNWVRGGMQSIFLQDANSLIIKPDDIVEILLYIKQSFPEVERITSYARAFTIARIDDQDLARISAAGLNRIHIGMESASDKVLTFVKKGVDKETQIIAGQKVKGAGIELSEYYMPGLGGEDFSRENALETADALNQINPDFIRIRTLAIPNHVELYEDYCAGTFKRLGDRMTAEELLLFLENLNGITSTVKSDHILNLLQEVEGTLPHDKEGMMAVIQRFLAMDSEEQLRYQIGKRSGIFSRLDDLEDSGKRKNVEAICAELHVTPDNVDNIVAEMMKRFI